MEKKTTLIMFQDDATASLVGQLSPMATGTFCDDHSHSGFICTREAGHSGPHVAHSELKTAVAIWGDARQAKSFTELRQIAERMKDELDKV